MYNSKFLSPPNQATEISKEFMEQVDSDVKVAVESVIQSESVVAESKKPEAQQTVSQAQPDAAQGNHFLINLD